MHTAKPLDDDSTALFIRAVRHGASKRRAILDRLWEQFLDGELFESPPSLHIETGEVTVTSWARKALLEADEQLEPFLEKHRTGSWGCILHDDTLLNAFSILHGGQVMSCHAIFPHQIILIVTRLRQKKTLVLIDHDLWVR